VIPGNLPPGVSVNFTRTCSTCGSTITVVEGAEQPHTCRVVIP
jgi:hypothetical protein